MRKENTHYSLIASLVPTPVEELLNEVFVGYPTSYSVASTSV